VIELSSTVTDTSEHPKAWLWQEDGPVVEGFHVRFDEATIDGRIIGIHVLKVDGVERSVWAFHKAFETKVGDELARRPSGDLDTGERVRYERLEKKESKDGRSYFPYKATFGNTATYKRKPAEIFKPSAPVDDGDESEGGADDDIPF
jgi:hypothetical protein